MLQRSWEIELYEREDGECPVREFIDKLSAEDQVRVTNAIGRLQTLGLTLRRPHVDYLGDDIYELRIKSRHNQYRVLYFIYNRSRFVLLHAISKKSGDVRSQDIKKAIEYRDSYLVEKQKGQRP